MSTIPVETPITSLPSASSVLNTDLYPAVDTTDHSEASTGTTKKYSIQQLGTYFNSSVTSNRASCRVASISNLVGTYNNGTFGVGATFTLTAMSVLTIDSVNVILGDRVLIAGQTSSFQNGIYLCTTEGSIGARAVLTRATDFDTVALMSEGSFVSIPEGTLQGNTIWMLISRVFTIGLDAVVFSNTTAESGGVVPLNRGGTNANLTANNGGIFYSNATSGAILSGTATAGKVLQSGSTAAPSWSTPTYPSASGTSNHYLVSSGVDNVYSSHALDLGGDITTDGSFELSGSFTTLFNISGNTNVTFPTSGTLATTGQLYDFVSVTTSTQLMEPNVIYYINYVSGQCVLSLPSTINLGDVFFVRGNSAGGWMIQASGTQIINIGNVPSSPGGSVSSDNQFDAIELSSPATDVLNVSPTISNQFNIL